MEIRVTNNKCAGLCLCFHEMWKILHESLYNSAIFSYINILPKNYFKGSVLCRISLMKERFPLVPVFWEFIT